MTTQNSSELSNGLYTPSRCKCCRLEAFGNASAKTWAPAAPTPGNLDVPVAESGKPIPVLFGTRVIRQANVVWYGDVKTTEIRQSSGSGGKK